MGEGGRREAGKEGRKAFSLLQQFGVSFYLRELAAALLQSLLQPVTGYLPRPGAETLPTSTRRWRLNRFRACLSSGEKNSVLQAPDSSPNKGPQVS